MGVYGEAFERYRSAYFHKVHGSYRCFYSDCLRPECMGATDHATGHDTNNATNNYDTCYDTGDNTSHNTRPF